MQPDCMIDIFITDFKALKLLGSNVLYFKVCSLLINSGHFSAKLIIVLVVSLYFRSKAKSKAVSPLLFFLLIFILFSSNKRATVR